MFTLLKPTQVRCEVCKHQAKSKINNRYRAICAVAVGFLIGIISGYSHISNVPLGLGKSFAGGLILPVMVIFGTFFAPNAHNCEKCGSSDLTECI